MEKDLKQISAEKKELEKLLLKAGKRFKELVRDKTLANEAVRARKMIAETRKFLRLRKKLIPLEKREKELIAKWEMRERMFDEEEK